MTAQDRELDQLVRETELASRRINDATAGEGATLYVPQWVLDFPDNRPHPLLLLLENAEVWPRPNETPTQALARTLRQWASAIEAEERQSQ